jgi:predicted metal-dependent phosphoesterase TrpH
MHSTYSDGYKSVAQIIDYVERATDLDVIAITDHDCIDGALKARDLVARDNYRLQIIVGAEISTQDGHLLALNIERLIPADLSMAESIQAIHEQGGLAIIAHPFSRWCPSATLETLIGRNLQNAHLMGWKSTMRALPESPATAVAVRSTVCGSTGRKLAAATRTLSMQSAAATRSIWAAPPPSY